MRKIALLIILILGIPLSAKADPIPMSPELKSFMMRPDQRQGVVGMMMHQWDVLVGDCSSKQMKSTNVVIDIAPTFDQSGMPIFGQWRVVSLVEGCDQSRVFNIQYSVPQSGPVQRTGLLPGTTAASMLLQKDALMYAFLSMQKLLPSKDCKDVQYTDTKFIGFGEASPSAMEGREKRSWNEEWTVRACGVTGVVPMHFVPDATGTAIAAEEAKPQ
ncbi:MAG TPA: hypothetical protein VFR09_07655 [Alphaproteobacteria bacterium]|nr:hypothetical protein [Alphaproteobacteria bacterium]